MKENVYDALNREQIANIRHQVEGYSMDILDIVKSIVKPYCEELDNRVAVVSDLLRESKSLTTDELESLCLTLSTDIYWASSMTEQLGIRDDISKAVYKEVYNSKRDTATGTVADKDSLAELESQQEYLTNVCYTRAYKIMKAKVDNAQDLLASCKKVLSRRITEMELTRIGGN